MESAEGIDFKVPPPWRGDFVYFSVISCNFLVFTSRSSGSMGLIDTSASSWDILVIDPRRGPFYLFVDLQTPNKQARKREKKRGTRRGNLSSFQSLEIFQSTMDKFKKFEAGKLHIVEGLDKKSFLPLLNSR